MAAAEAVAAADSSVAGTIGANQPHTAWETRTEARSRYYELRARVHQHREAAHAHGSQFRCVSQAHW